MAKARLLGSTSLADAVRSADSIIEAVPEKLELKQQLAKAAMSAAPAHAVFATNTSSLPVSEIARTAPDPARVCGMHFFNPPLVLKLLELVRAEQTSDTTMALARSVGERMGREIIVVKDSPGFATSRLGVVLALEAMRMVESGVASAEDIDRAMEHGYRHQMGPLPDRSGWARRALGHRRASAPNDRRRAVSRARDFASESSRRKAR